MNSKQEEPHFSNSRRKRVLQALKSIRITLPFVPYVDLVELMTTLRRLQHSRMSLDDKVRKAYDSLQEAVQLISELEGSMKGSMEKLGAIRQEYERYSKLAGTEQEKAMALLDQVEKSLSKRKGSERLERFLISLVAGFIIFVLGILLGPTIKMWFGMS